jgi:hypothetical protein
LLQQPVLNVGLGLPALGCLARLHAVVDQEPHILCGLAQLLPLFLKVLLESRDIFQLGQVLVADKDVRRGDDVFEQVADYVVVPEAIVDDDALLAQDGDFCGSSVCGDAIGCGHGELMRLS